MWWRLDYLVRIFKHIAYIKWQLQQNIKFKRDFELRSVMCERILGNTHKPCVYSQAVLANKQKKT